MDAELAWERHAAPETTYDIAEADETESTDALHIYLREAARYPQLSAAEERALARRIREDGDAAAQEAFVQANLRLVVHVARDYASGGLSLLDLIQEGNIGLLKAVARFDERKGFRFSTYAVWWIRQQITKAIWGSHGPLKVPQRLIDAHKKAQREAPEANDGPAPWNVVTVRGVEAEEHLNNQPAYTADAPETVAENREVLQMILAALSEASARDQQIITELFGLDDAVPLQLEAVASRHHITVERVRQIKNATFSAIRRSPYAAALVAAM